MTYTIDVTIPEAQKIFYYSNDDDLEYGIVRLANHIKYWMDENLEKGWHHSIVSLMPVEHTFITFTFMDEEDAVAFKLMWL